MTFGWPTLGEAVAERTLRKENSGGVEHYVEGQHFAEVESEGDDKAALVSWVGAPGLCLVPLIWTDGGPWRPLIPKFRLIGLSVDYGHRELPEDWQPTEDMLSAISRAEGRTEHSTSRRR